MAKAAPKKAAPKKAAPKLGLEERVTELEGDLARLVNLIGGVLGEPFRANALELVKKHQGAE